MKTKFKCLCLFCAVIALSYATGCASKVSSDNMTSTDASITTSDIENKKTVSANDLVGNWRYQLNSSSTVSKYSFSPSGTFTHSAGDGMYKGNGTYSVSTDGTLTITMEVGPSTGTKVLEYLPPEEISTKDSLSGYWSIESGNRLYIDSKEGYLKQ